MEIASKNRSYVKNQQTACIDYRVVLFTGVGKPPVCVGKHHLYRLRRYRKRTCLNTSIIPNFHHQETHGSRVLVSRNNCAMKRKKEPGIFKK